MSEARARLLELERRLDPADPTGRGTGLQVLGYGEVSAVLGLAGLPGRVLKRMSGFPTRDAAERYAATVERYVGILRELGVRVVETELLPLEPVAGRHVVYLVQPLLDPERLGHALLRRGPLAEVLPLLESVLGLLRLVLGANAGRRDGREVAVDAQLSNWHWDPERDGAGPILIDVGTPFMRKDGVLEIGTELFLRPYPAPARFWLRRTRAVERYLEAFFRFEGVVTDLLGNFVKEGQPEKLPAAIEFVNAWIARQPDAARLGRVDAEAVRAYYANDAATLELALRIRRLGRFVTTRLLRRRYDFILPGRIAR